METRSTAGSLGDSALRTCSGLAEVTVTKTWEIHEPGIFANALGSMVTEEQATVRKKIMGRPRNSGSSTSVCTQPFANG